MLYLVDDAADYRLIVQQVFRLFLPAYSLQLFVDGLELIQHVEQQSRTLTNARSGPNPHQPLPAQPGLIILDLDMPKLTGFQTLERLKQYPLWQSIPVIIMSNRPESGYREAAHESGAVSYVSKPMDVSEMRDVMGKLCQQWLDS